MSPRISAPSHRGLGLRFFRGGGWYRRRLDFDLGMVSRFRGRHSINVGVAGVPSWAVDSLPAGDATTLVTRGGTFVYRVLWTRAVLPWDDWVVGRTALPSLTLTTCWPRFSASHRLVVRAVQIYGRGPHGFID